MTESNPSPSEMLLSTPPVDAAPARPARSPARLATHHEPSPEVPDAVDVTNNAAVTSPNLPEPAVIAPEFQSIPPVEAVAESGSTATSHEPPPTGDQENLELTPLRTHYLKKALVASQFAQELEIIASPPPAPGVSALSYLGQPFTPLPKGAPPRDLPLLRFMFRQFGLTFPFLAAAPPTFFPQKVQPFFDSLMARNFSAEAIMSEGQDSEEATRAKLMARFEKNMSFLLISAIKLVDPEDVVRLTQADLERLERISARRRKRLEGQKDTFEVNIVCVRTVSRKGSLKIRTRTHEVRFRTQPHVEAWNLILLGRI
jgi:hypothetical protein